MGRDTPSSRARSRVLGSRVPERKVRSRIALRSWSSIWRPTVRGLSRSTATRTSRGLLVNRAPYGSLESRQDHLRQGLEFRPGGLERLFTLGIHAERHDFGP